MEKHILVVLFAAALIGLGIYTNMKKDETPVVPYKLEQAFLSSSNSKEFVMTYTGSDAYYVKDTSPIPRKITVRVTEDSDSEITFVITDNNSFHLPENEFFPSSKPTADTYFSMIYRNIVAIGNINERVLPDGGTEAVFDTTKFDFIYSALYSTIGTSLTNNYLYGFGERRKKFRYDADGQYTTLPKDQFGMFDDGTPDHQTYGYHPMWLRKENNGNFHIGFLKSTSPLRTDIVAGKSLTLHIVGGEIHLKFFFGDKNPENVVKAYHNYINGYAIHPFWSQGYHHSRWGFKSSKDMLDARQKFQDNGFPIDVIWNDLDYMVAYQDFTLQPLFKPEEMNEITDVSKDIGLYWVPLIDMGVAIHTDAAEDGLKKGIFLQSSVYNRPLIACVWPGSVYYPDFNHPGSFNYWDMALKSMYTKLNLKPWGYWIDMNENSNFIPGERNDEEDCPPADPPVPPAVKKEIDDTLYVPFSVSGSQPLAHKNPTMATWHYNKSDALLVANQNTTELFFHPLSSYGEAYITYKSLQDSTKSPLVFILTRANFYGSGRYVAHWTGDNVATWKFLSLAVAELLPYQLFGIPLVGQDLCGFATSTTPELCTRWMQLGAWTPFSRNHNDNKSIDQAPYAFKEQYVLTGTRKAFLQRYSHLKWLYSLFVRNWDRYQSFGSGTVMKPIWWQFPDDSKAFDFEDVEFMMGEEILVAPVLVQGDAAKQSTTIDVYLPGTKSDLWIAPNIQNGQIYQGSTTQSFDIPFDDYIPYFIRGGYIVARQQPALRARLLDNNFYLDVALKPTAPGSTSYSAVGKMMSLNSYEDHNVYDNCLTGVADCIAEVSLVGTFVDKKFTGTFTIKGSTNLTNFQDFFIQYLNVFGLGQVVKYTFAAPVKGPVSTSVTFSV